MYRKAVYILNLETVVVVVGVRGQSAHSFLL